MQYTLNVVYLFDLLSVIIIIILNIPVGNYNGIVTISLKKNKKNKFIKLQKK